MPSEGKGQNAALGDTGRRSWREAFEIYLHPRVLGMLFLGFSAGLPFLLVFSTLSAWLREAGVERAEIGFLSWVGITYSIKVFWAPVVDRLPIPLLTRALGRRRSWMLLAQCGIAVGLMGIAVADVGLGVGAVVFAALLVAFSSATQDVAIDAYRIEAAEESVQGAMAATYQYGYRIGLLAAGAGALFIADFASWFWAYAAMAGLVGVGMVTVLVIREPEGSLTRGAVLEEPEVQAFMSRLSIQAEGARRALGWFYGAVVSPLVDFFKRNGWLALLILGLVGTYRLSDITMGVMANPFYIDLGFTKTEIAAVAKGYGLFAGFAGTFLGGLLVARYGIMKPLFLGAVLMIVTNLLFAWLAVLGADLGFLIVTISADNLAGGLGGTVFIAYLSSLTNRAYSATQYALFSSLFTLPGKFVGGWSGVVVDSAGYVNFFIYAGLLGIPAVLLVLLIARYGRRLLPNPGGA
ncbi:MAG: MFS transporter [Limibacillus sp.]|jgi:MFS transporter, PAT family, beta-lactamase induction signal transducer AmpG